MWQANEYIDDVLSQRTVACHWVKQACQGHVDDLEHGAERGLHFDQTEAEHVLKFSTILKHSKGEWAGQPLELEPWQQFMLWVLFGWKRADGTRRFRTAYIEVARKIGKSTMGAGIGLYLLAADGEPGAESYSAATKRDQARITHLEAVRMVRASPMLKKRIRTFRDNLNIENTRTGRQCRGSTTVLRARRRTTRWASSYAVSIPPRKQTGNVIPLGALR